MANIKMNNPNQESSPGQILSGENNRNKNGRNVHMMVYLGPSDLGDHFFEGAMLTSSMSVKYKNVSIPSGFFLKVDATGNSYPFPNRETAIRPRRHIKLNVWAPFTLVGELSSEGLGFVLDVLGDTEAVFNENNE